MSENTYYFSAVFKLKTKRKFRFFEVAKAFLETRVFENIPDNMELIRIEELENSDFEWDADTP